MKKAVVLLTMLVVLFTGCSAKKNIEEADLNYFFGVGELRSCNEYNNREIIYDDKNTYTLFGVYGYLCLDEDMNAYSICNDAACRHDSTDCMAYAENNYFVFNEKLYTATNVITECSNGEIVFKNNMPEEYKEDTDAGYYSKIDDVRIIDDKYIVLREGGFVYILNSNFEPIFYHNNISSSTWAMIKDGKYYYVNDLCEIIMIDIETHSEEKYDVGTAVYRAYNNDKYIFYVDKYFDLYRIDMETEETVCIGSGVYDALVTDKYIYYSENKNMGEMPNVIIDMEGNSIKLFDDESGEFKGSPDFGFARWANDKIYVNESDENGKSYVLQMNEDGTEIKEYEVRN